MSLIILFFVIVRERASICFRLSSTNTAMRNVFYLVVLVVLLAHWQRLRAIGSSFLPFFSETFALCFRGNFLFIIIVYLSWLDVLFKIFILKCNRICGAYRLQLWHDKLHPIQMSLSGPVHFISGLSTFRLFLYFWVHFQVGLVSC